MMAPSNSPSIPAGPPGHSRATFKTQANALFRKNAVSQKRNRKTNCCIIISPVLFLLILLLIQKAADSAIGGSRDSKCGCKCTECKFGDQTLKNVAPADNFCPPGTYDECVTYDDTQCGIQFSDGAQAGYCPIPNPTSWPPVMPVAEPRWRSEIARPAQAMLYTGADKAAADGIAARLFPVPLSRINASSRASIVSAFSASANNLLGGAQVGEALSGLGYTIGSPQETSRRYYVENAFLSRPYSQLSDAEKLSPDNREDAIYNMVPDCATDTSTAELNSLLSGGQLSLNFSCTTAVPTFRPTADAINELLYCGYRQARCGDGTTGDVYNEFSYAWDFQASAANRGLQLALWNNDTRAANVDGNGAPPSTQRIVKGVNLATNAYLSWALGDSFAATLLAIEEMPKTGSRLNVDLGSLLGPLFYAWLFQLLLPIILVQLVYEKEKGLRVMMKMHGLGDAAYWGIQYIWSFVLYVLYAVVVVAFGSLIDLQFFRINDYGVQIVFYLVWGNCLIAFTFFASTLFTSTKTAVVTAFLWVFGTGLLGNLLLEAYFDKDRVWLYFVELIPAFGLYRGLFEFASYAFRASYQGNKGLTFGDFGDPNNHMGYVLGIFAAEWAVFLLLAWYFDQVLPSGAGVRRPLLFFLQRKKPAGPQPMRAPGTVAPLDKPSSRKKLIAAITGTPTTGATIGTGGTYNGATKNGDMEAAVPLSMEGEDVREERARVEEMADFSSQAIVIRDLHKVYPAQDGNPAKLAVRGLTMAVERGECFGLLGPNGAGKSTSLNMLVGLLEPTGGDALIEGESITSNMQAIYAMMGVCPQHDLLWENLTGREHLLFYGRLKSVPEAALKSAVDAALRSVNLFNGGVGDKQVRMYSGGMKRRLSVAISFIGSPRVVYLDEPSTGLDPASRRNLWDVVKANKAGRGMILTTHSMEEAQVLCDRLGIFVDGQLVCIGNPRELTTRYGGYLVFTITTPPGPDVDKAAAFVMRMCPAARPTYALGGTQRFELPANSSSISGVFQAMEEAKKTITVLDWGVANATLEEVFIKFARSIGAEGGN